MIPGLGTGCCSEHSALTHFNLKAALAGRNCSSHATYEESASDEILGHVPTFVLQLGDAQTGSNPGSPASKAQLRLTKQQLWELKSQTEMSIWSVRDGMNHGAWFSHESEQNGIMYSSGLKRRTYVMWNETDRRTAHAEVNVSLIELKSECQNLWTMMWWMETWGEDKGAEMKLGRRNYFHCSVAQVEYWFSVIKQKYQKR